MEVNQYGSSVKNCKLEEQEEMKFCGPKHRTYTLSESVGQRRLSNTQFLYTCVETFLLFCKSSVFLLGQTVKYGISFPVSDLSLQLSTFFLFLLPIPSHLFLMQFSCHCPCKWLNSQYLKYSDLNVFIFCDKLMKKLLSAFSIWISVLFFYSEKKMLFRLTNVSCAYYLVRMAKCHSGAPLPLKKRDIQWHSWALWLQHLGKQCNRPLLIMCRITYFQGFN